MFYIYILYSSEHDLHYVGHTQDAESRLHQHNYGDFNTYTSKFRPWKIAALFEVGTTRKDAVRLEIYIKRQKSRNLILKLTDPGFEPTGILAELVRVPRVRN